MCNRYSLYRLDRLIAEYREAFGPGFEEISEKRIVPRFNIAPTQTVPVVLSGAEGTPKLVLARWGFVPSWTRGKPELAPTNAKAETIDSSRLFRTAFARRRCLIPTDGFYEWQGAKPPKQPYFIHRKDDRGFSFAGIWERWKPGPEEEPIDTFAMITMSPNALMEPIHKRMPSIVTPELYRSWLNPDTASDVVADALKPWSAEEFEARPISTRVNNVRNEGPDLLE